MGRFFKKMRDIWSHEELRKRIGITLGFILIYRVGSFIVIPGVDSDTLQEQMSALGGGGLGDILSLFTGGAFSRARFLRSSLYSHDAPPSQRGP